MQIKIKSLRSEAASDINYQNITPGSIHETIEAPEGYEAKDGQVFVQGVESPALLTSEEYFEYFPDLKLTAYNVKTKEKGVPIQNAVIKRTAKGAYMVQGDDGRGHKLTTLANEKLAIAALNHGIATKEGW